jgi:hypothetical protein
MTTKYYLCTWMATLRSSGCGSYVNSVETDVVRAIVRLGELKNATYVLVNTLEITMPEANTLEPMIDKRGITDYVGA